MIVWGKAKQILSDIKPKLLVLASTYPRWPADHEPGFVHELTKRLCSDFEVTVLCPHSGGAKEIDELDHVRVIRYRYAPEQFETLVNDGGIVGNLKQNPLKWLLLPIFFLAQVWVLRRILRNWKPDVIHAHWLIPQGLAVALAKKMSDNSPPLLVTSHGADLYALKASLFRRLKRLVGASASEMTVVSNAMKEEANRIGLPDSNIEVQPMGVDLLDTFSVDPDQPRSENEILFVGRLVEKKGLRYLLDAMPEILRSHPEAKLNIVGYGPEEQNLREQVKALHLRENVEFYGAVKQTDLPAYYRRAAVFVAPFVEASDGDQEGLGLVLVEALGCGCPTIVSDMPAVKDVVSSAQSVKVVAPRQSAMLAKSVIETLSEPSSAMRKVEGATDLLQARFDWTSVAERYAQILRRIVKEQRVDS